MYRRLDQDEYVRLSLTSSKDVFRTSSRHLQDVFKTSSRCFVKASSRNLQDVFKTSSKCFEDLFKTSSIHLEDIFNLVNISSRRFQGISSSYTVLVNTSLRSIQYVSETFFFKDGYLQRNLPR